MTSEREMTFEAIRNAVRSADASGSDTASLQKGHLQFVLGEVARLEKESHAQRPMLSLVRYGIRWKSQHELISEPMPDGYWTPWFLAEAAIKTLEDAEQRAVSRLSAVLEGLRNVEPYVQHMAECRWYEPQSPALGLRYCDCGLDNLLAALRTVGEQRTTEEKR